MKLPRRRLAQLLLAGATVGVPLGTVLMPAAGRAQRIFAENGLAVRGTDVVAYFSEGRPVPGRAEFTHDWGGATWRFASAANRDRFAADPARYAPAYGGFCAYAVSEGYTAPIDPAAWRIVEGRLFLNYDRRTQRIWEGDIPGRIARADANWPRLAAR
ncbi:YHS domain-containing (seleno)protein [Falsiroseomonas sp.]|uniref:YHS domain-containing (seleno)protein n=1 Tax=Falsiroseomonas sp. TaxID=2870721 RepID=UPI00356AB8AA